MDLLKACTKTFLTIFVGLFFVIIISRPVQAAIGDIYSSPSNGFIETPSGQNSASSTGLNVLNLDTLGSNPSFPGSVKSISFWGYGNPTFGTGSTTINCKINAITIASVVKAVYSFLPNVFVGAVNPYVAGNTYGGVDGSQLNWHWGSILLNDPFNGACNFSSGDRVDITFASGNPLLAAHDANGLSVGSMSTTLYPLGACTNIVATTTNVSTNIAANTTWNANQTYVVSGSVAINSGKTLTVQPCSVIKFATATSTLTVNGVLDAESTSSPIYFTSYKDDTVGGDTNADGPTTAPSAGDWKSIITSSTGSTTLSDVVVAYGGSTGTTSPMVYNTSGKLAIVNSTIATSSSYGVGMAGGTVNIASTTLNNNLSGAAFINLSSGGTFTHAATTDSGNGVNGIVVSGTINANTEWTKDRTVSPIPYVPKGVVTIATAKTLTIDPGVVVKFNDPTSGLSVNGTVNAQAANNSTIFLTSIYDNETESLATSSPTTPAGGDWKDITVNSGGTTNLSNAVVRYGGHVATSTSGSLLNNNGGNINISASSTIAYGTTYGIKNTNGTTTVTTSDLAYNNYGLYVSGGSASITASSTIHNNSLYGVYNSTTATTTATGDFWGDNSGPYNALYNSSGVGNAASNKVSFFPFIGGNGTTSQIHYVEPSGNTAVVGSYLTTTSDTKYASQLSTATTTWNALGSINITPATTSPSIPPDLYITDENTSDLPETGRYISAGTGMGTSTILLNQYFLNQSTTNDIVNTITHELGHALGLDHSFTGNIMYFNKNPQTSLGSQDISDYDCLWLTQTCSH